MGYTVVKDQHHDDGRGQGQNDPPQNAEIAASVQKRRFMQLPGNGIGKEGTRHDQVVGGDRAADQQYCPAVQQSQLSDVQIAGDQPSAEIHGDHEQRHDEALAGAVSPGKCVGRGNRQRQIDERSKEGVENGVGIARPDLLIVENKAVGLQRGVDRQQDHFPAGYGLGVADGRADDEQQRVKGHDGDQNQQRVIDPDEDPISPGKPGLAPPACGMDAHVHVSFFLHYQRLEWASDLDSVLASTRMTQLTAELNRPVAVENAKSFCTIPTLYT